MAELVICKWLKSLFLPAWMKCDHDPIDLESQAIINGVVMSKRKYKSCRKCGATSAMVKFK